MKKRKERRLQQPTKAANTSCYFAKSPFSYASFASSSTKETAESSYMDVIYLKHLCCR